MNNEAMRAQDETMEATVAGYLARHADFFHRHPELAGEMTLPHPVHDKAVSLVDRQVSLLREQKLELKHKLQHLSQVARGNEQLLERLQKLILDLIDSRELNGAIELVESAMRRDFHADAVSVWLFNQPSGQRYAVDRDDKRLQVFGGLLETRRPACGLLRSDQLAALFGANPDVTSCALIPLCEGEGNECLGLVAIGSVDPKRYHAEMGTVFLAHLGAVAARVIRARSVHGS